MRAEAGLELLGARLDPTFGGPHRDSSDNTRSPETDSLCARDGSSAVVSESDIVLKITAFPAVIIETHGHP